MKLEADEVVCDVCREIIKKEGSKEYVAYYEFGGVSSRSFMKPCCKTHPTYENKCLIGRTYA